VSAASDYVGLDPDEVDAYARLLRVLGCRLDDVAAEIGAAMGLSGLSGLSGPVGSVMELARGFDRLAGQLQVRAVEAAEFRVRVGAAPEEPRAGLLSGGVAVARVGMDAGPSWVSRPPSTGHPWPTGGGRVKVTPRPEGRTGDEYKHPTPTAAGGKKVTPRPEGRTGDEYKHPTPVRVGGVRSARTPDGARSEGRYSGRLGGRGFDGEPSTDSGGGANAQHGESNDQTATKAGVETDTEVKGPADSPVWAETEPARGKTRTNGERGRAKEYYEWDYTHNDIEVYDGRGLHKGSKDPTTGEMTKPPVKGRRINV
jgi:hypothetical protein